MIVDLAGTLEDSAKPGGGSAAVVSLVLGAFCCAACGLPVDEELTTRGRATLPDGATMANIDAGTESVDRAEGDASSRSEALHPLADAGRPDGSVTMSCDWKLLGRIRDFGNWHPDFNLLGGSSVVSGMVEPELGQDGTPVPAAFDSGSIVPPLNFVDWFHDDYGNIPLDVTLSLSSRSDGHFVYRDSSYFPIDGQGYGRDGDDEHNHFFTSHLRARFRYMGGESITVAADDDLWVFIDGKLVVDLGGAHGVISRRVSIDQESSRLGLKRGSAYALEVFAAQRRAPLSSLSIDVAMDCLNLP